MDQGPEKFFIKFSWSVVEGDMANVFDVKKVKAFTYSGRIVFQNREQTFRELLKPTAEFADYWRLIFAGKQLNWDERVPVNVSIHLVARIGHWSDGGYQRNNPTSLFKI